MRVPTAVVDRARQLYARPRRPLDDPFLQTDAEVVLAEAGRLVHDAGARRHHFESVQGGLPPAQELVTLTVARELQVEILQDLRAVAVAAKFVESQILAHFSCARMLGQVSALLTQPAGSTRKSGGLMLTLPECASQRWGNVCTQQARKIHIKAVVRRSLCQSVRPEDGPMCAHTFQVKVATSCSG